jgi:hypothetical protein
MRLVLIPVLAAFAASHCTAQKKDAAGCKDSPLVERFPGSVIAECTDKADGSYTFIELGPNSESRTIAGEHHYTMYELPDSTGAPQVIRNLQIALKTAGYRFIRDNRHGGFTVHLGRTWIDFDVTNIGNYKQNILIEPESKK